MNYPYKWANSKDEEGHQGSPWESEPEGENAEELASLEAPDDEGRVVLAQKSQNHQMQKASGPKTSVSLTR